MKLNKYDYELLDFLQIQGKSSLETILKRFPDNKYGTKYRLRILSKINKNIYNDEDNYFAKLKDIKYENYVIENNVSDTPFHFVSDNTFSLSSKGRKALIDYKLYAKEQERENLKKNITFYSQLIFTAIIMISNIILAIKS